jgi:iron complex transport system ATP-binding protein
VLLGVNGIGKSTLLKTLAGLIEPLRIDQYRWQGYILPFTCISRTAYQRSIHRQGFDSFITVRELITLGRYPYTNWSATLSADDTALIDHAIETLGLGNLVHKKVTQISDGERQKTLIAKSIAQAHLSS